MLGELGEDYCFATARRTNKELPFELGETPDNSGNRFFLIRSLLKTLLCVPG
jgi:hypothetical protein